MILVDDGLATGASMRAAVLALREDEPAQIVVAVPAAPESTCREFAGMVDDLVCASMPTPFFAVGESFWDFTQVTDDEVRTLLATPTTAATESTPESPAMAVSAAAVDAPDGIPPAEVLDALIGDARIVLIGESSHGTHEFYAARAEITKWLIEHKGFTAVAAEADWPDAYRVNRYVRGQGDDVSAEGALSGFERFPGWMWRNDVVRDFVTWLREHNGRATEHRVGFYGLDLYSLHRSMDEVITYLEGVDPRPPPGPGRATPASITPPPTTARPTATPRHSAPARRASGRRWRSWSRYIATRSAICATTGWSPRTNCSARSRTPRPCAMPRSTTAPCSAAGSPPGTCATGTWPRPSTRCCPTSTGTAESVANPPGSWCGRTTPTSATPGRPRSAPTGN